MKKQLPSKKTNFASTARSWIIPVAGLLVLVVALGVVFQNGINPTGLVIASRADNASLSNESIPPGGSAADGKVTPSQFLSRQQYFEEAFRIDRESYAIFEKAADFSGRLLDQMPAYFSLGDEEQIWSQLPPVPNDFSEIAFLLATGKFFAIQDLDERYMKQPEFYPGFKDTGLRFWTQPDATSWASNGYGTYPSEQWADLTLGETDTFEATVFIYSGFGVQTYQGLSLFVDAASQSFFDVSVSPDTFVLEPTFPQFHPEWAKKILVTGKIKPETPAGEYTITVNVGIPPESKRQEWGTEYRNLYADAASGVRPSGNPITLHVTVK